MNRRQFWYLDGFTAWLFQFCLISELTITFCFWVWLWVCGTDVSKLSGEQVRNKLVYDLFKDIENFDHSLPLLLLLIEYAINNIPFTWLHWFTIVTIQICYNLSQWFYCVNISHKPVYDSIDWENDLPSALLKSNFPIVVSAMFAVIVINVTNCKVMSATGINCSKEL